MAAVRYVEQGTCDASDMHELVALGANAAAEYAEGALVERFVVTADGVSSDALDRDRLTAWLGGHDPDTGAMRGRNNVAENSAMVYDATVNLPKSFSIAAILDDDLRVGLSVLQDKIRDHSMRVWADELYVRRDTDGSRRVELAQIEVAELRHERSRALDPHIHRHMWLNARALGVDGRWSNLEGRAVFRVQAVVNAEGNMIAHTDPEWVALLASKGFTLNPETGEISELAHLNTALSKRSAQIEGNRARKIAEWKAEHPGQEPGPESLTVIDRWAWAQDRPDKPENLNEADWAARVREQIAGIDPDTASARVAVTPPPAPTTASRKQVAEAALVAVRIADQRALRHGGRVSAWDIRAAAADGLLAVVPTLAREAFTVVQQQVIAAAHEHVTNLTDTHPETVPAGAKAFIANSTWRAREHLDRLAAQLTQPGVRAAEETVLAHCDPAVKLDASQVAAACLIAGTDQSVVITGAAGAGKTTMLKPAVAALAAQGRRTVIVAPSRKAAGLAGREVDAAATSVDMLLIQHGYTRPAVGAVTDDWAFPRKLDSPSDASLRLGPGDRIVVDEAGMLDIHKAAALVDLAQRTGACLALIGDERQVDPVGHIGAMSTIRAHATGTATLTSIHRFRNPDGSTNTEYAALTLRMRQPADDADRTDVAARLVDGTPGAQVVLADDQPAANQAIVDTFLNHYSRQATPKDKPATVAIVTSTNEEAQHINTTIQAALIAQGRLDASRAAAGIDGQPFYLGDIIQTRQNDRDAGVNNRDLWRVTSIRANGSILARPVGSGKPVTLTADYLAEHTHLAYASTVHGIQGETVDHTIIGPGVDAAGLYVGATRGTRNNHIIVTAPTAEHAKKQLADTLKRGAHAFTPDDIRDAAHTELDLTTDPAANSSSHGSEKGARPESERFTELARTVLPDADRLLSSAGWEATVVALGAAEAAGINPGALLDETYNQRGFGDADDIGAVISWRVTRRATELTATHRDATVTQAPARTSQPANKPETARPAPPIIDGTVTSVGRVTTRELTPGTPSQCVDVTVTDQHGQSRTLRLWGPAVQNTARTLAPGRRLRAETGPTTTHTNPDGSTSEIINTNAAGVRTTKPRGAVPAQPAARPDDCPRFR